MEAETQGLWDCQGASYVIVLEAVCDREKNCFRAFGAPIVVCLRPSCQVNPVHSISQFHYSEIEICHDIVRIYVVLCLIPVKGNSEGQETHICPSPTPTHRTPQAHEGRKE